MPKHTGLGKGLDALIPSGFQASAPPPAEAAGSALLVPIHSIVPNPRQPRTHFEPQALQELADSIREHGVIQPLLVSRAEGQEGYTLIAGERRWQASQIAGLKEVPVILRQTTDQQKLLLALIENVQRADLNALEEAQAYRQLAQEFHLSQEEIAQRVGKSRVAVTNTLRLLKLPAIVLQALLDSKISEGHARAILGAATPQQQTEALKTVLAKDLTVRQTEELVRNYGGVKKAAAPKPQPAPDLADIEERIRSSLNAKARLKAGKDGKGSLTLFYFSNEELNALLQRLLNE
jgi:ParB family chromosome partitioning protein